MFIVSLQNLHSCDLARGEQKKHPPLRRKLPFAELEKHNALTLQGDALLEQSVFWHELYLVLNLGLREAQREGQRWSWELHGPPRSSACSRLDVQNIPKGPRASMNLGLAGDGDVCCPSSQAVFRPP